MDRAAIGYARVSIDAHDLAAQQDALAELGVDRGRIYVDFGLVGADRERPGLRAALAACRRGDTLVVTELHRLAHSVADACEISERLAERGTFLNVGGRSFDVRGPDGRLILDTLAAVAGFEAALVRARTKEGLEAARAKGRLRGKPPKLGPEEQARLVDLHHNEGRSPDELAEMFGVARSTVYRVLDRARRGAITPTREASS